MKATNKNRLYCQSTHLEEFLLPRVLEMQGDATCVTSFQAKGTTKVPKSRCQLLARDFALTTIEMTCLLLHQRGS